MNQLLLNSKSQVELLSEPTGAFGSDKHAKVLIVRLVFELCYNSTIMANDDLAHTQLYKKPNNK